MTTASSFPEKAQVPALSLLPFLGITFGLAWGILALYLLLPEVMAGAFGRLTGQHPLFYLAVYAPAIAAIVIVIFRSGPGGLRRYLGRLLLWRCPPAWYAFLVVGVPLFFYGGALLKGNLFTDPFPFSSVPAILLALALFAIKGPVEELGWRGFALPLLQRRLAPFWAGLVLGLIWGLWHLPAFLLSGTQQSAWSFAPFFIGTVAISLIMTALFGSSRGSILLPALLHFQFINPIWPDAQPYDTYLILPAAILIVWIHRKAMFRREGAVTEVVPMTRPKGCERAS
jgi:membrane protease YdiL (CAAX protease family)